MDKANVKFNTEIILDKLPWFVKEFHHSKLVAGNSMRTLYEYYNEYKRFFDWLIQSGVVDDTSDIEGIRLDHLENLPKKDAEAYFAHLRERDYLVEGKESRGENNLSDRTVERTYRALSSLFSYLTEQSETANGEPFFYRNVMKKVKTNTRNKETLQSRAASLKSKIYDGQKTDKFLEFIDDDVSAEGYVHKAGLSPRAKTSYYQNKERDLAIIALLLASGVRLSELVYLDIEDLNINDLRLTVTRKGNKKDSPHFAPFALPYLEAYLDIRTKRYFKGDKNAAQSEKALFLSISSGSPRRLGGAAIERTVAKYSQAFEQRTTPHKLRHSFATRLYGQTKNDVMLATQLGHASTTLIAVYAHADDEEVREEMDKL